MKKSLQGSLCSRRDFLPLFFLLCLLLGGIITEKYTGYFYHCSSEWDL